MWTNESAAVRSDYKAKAEKLKQEHLRKYPGYQYQPRKPSEKKRRVSKKKVTALSVNFPLEPVASFKLASHYPQMAGADNAQNGAATRTVTFPLSPAAQLAVQAGIQNGQYLSTVALPDNFAPADTYSAVQQSDQLLIDFPDFGTADLSDPDIARIFADVSQEYQTGVGDDLGESYFGQNVESNVEENDGETDADFSAWDDYLY
jgi:hypothetical protein